MGSYYARNLERLGFKGSVEKIMKAYSVGGSRAASDAVYDLIGELSIIGDVEKIREKLRTLPQNMVPIFSFEPSSPTSVPKLRMNLLEPLLREQD